ncbi:hypothetical protein TRIUR3_21912 [Triticum urartu]|uniref:Uncharacterized protein n=1 Tax=Triticum urartu TaxID=4572 RepID=M7Y7R1_TRIUA|nr:hypothetical protein TRIUR3_21912 [Triticum urartu]
MVTILEHLEVGGVGKGRVHTMAIDCNRKGHERARGRCSGIDTPTARLWLCACLLRKCGRHHAEVRHTLLEIEASCHQVVDLGGPTLDEIRVGTLIGAHLVEGCVELLEVLLGRGFNGFDLVVDLAKTASLYKKFQQAPELVKRDSDEKSTRLEAEDKTSDVEVKEESGSDSDEDPQSGEELPAHVERRRRAKKQHIASITLADIAPYFHLPIREASRALKIGVSILKQKCRQYGIPRWPHRKIKSLDSLISDLEFVMDDTDGDVVQKETRRQREKEREKEKEKEKQEAIQALAKRKRLLESEKEIIQQKPALDLMAETKLFREDVFKRRYRAKRLPGQ